MTKEGIAAYIIRNEELHKQLEELQIENEQLQFKYEVSKGLLTEFKSLLEEQLAKPWYVRFYQATFNPEALTK